MEVGLLNVVKRPMGLIDENSPRQVCWSSEGFLIKEITPAPNGLAENEARGVDIDNLPEGKTLQAGINQRRNYASDNCPMNCESTVPEGEDFPYVIPVQVPGEDDIVESGPYDGTYKHVKEQIVEELDAQCLPFGFSRCQDQSEDHPSHDKHSVPSDAQGTDLEDYRFHMVQFPPFFPC